MATPTRIKFADKVRELCHKLTVALVSNLNRKADLEASLDRVDADIERLESEVKEASELEDDLVEFVTFGLEYTNNLKEHWWELDHEDRQVCKQLLFPQGFSVGSDEKVYTPEISPFYRLAANKKDLRIDRKSLLVELRGIAPRSAKLLTSVLQA